MENVTNQQVGARVARVRVEMKMTQAELATEMSVRLGREVRPLTVTRLEGGKRPIAVDELLAAAAALRVSAADLLSDDDLPVGAIRITSAGQELFRAMNALHDAVQDWTWAHDRLEKLLAEGKSESSLPAGSSAWLQILTATTLDSIVSKAQTEARNV